MVGADPIMGSAQPSRMVSLDALRGLTVAAMILVADPGTYSAVYPQLLRWTGVTATDMDSGACEYSFVAEVNGKIGGSGMNIHSPGIEF
jgi:uncharacterized membrane protein